MDRLLGPGGCPWDQEQTHRTLRPYVVEEAYEVVAAIDEGHPAKLRDELGDLLLQVVFHAALAERDGHFDLNDVVGAIIAKLRRRHPHVYADRRLSSGAAVLRQWEDIKLQEAADAGAGAGSEGVRLEKHLPALMQAQKLLERASRVGHRPALLATTPTTPPRSGPDGETGLARDLLSLLDQARRAGLDAELVLRTACAALAHELDARHGGEPHPGQDGN